METDNQKQVEYLLRCSNAPERAFVYSREAEESQTQKYNYFKEDMKIKWLISGEYGMISDAYILYMISLLQHADVETITEMLEAYARTYKELSLAQNMLLSSRQAVPAIEMRVKQLVKMGMANRRSYDVKRPDGTSFTVSLYCTDRDTQTFVNRKLHKQMVMHPWLMAQPLNDAIAHAAAGYAASKVAFKGGCMLRSIKEDAMKTTEMGVVIMPPWLFLDRGDEKYQVVFYPVFLTRVGTYQTDGDFERAIRYKVQSIKNYLYLYASQKRETARKAYCVLVCESRQDMENMRKVILQTQVLIGCGNLSRIYFTSEGAIRTLSEIQDAFLGLEMQEDGDVHFISEIPPFLKGR